MPHCSVLATVFYIVYINDAAAELGTHLALLVSDMCIYVTEKRECRVLCALQRGLTAVTSWCERWNIRINEEKIQAMSFSRTP